MSPAQRSCALVVAALAGASAFSTFAPAPNAHAAVARTPVALTNQLAAAAQQPL